MSEPTLRECVAAFLAAYRNPGTRMAYARVLLPFVALFPAEVSLTALLPAALDTWYATIPPHYRPATVDNHVRSLKRFFNWCVEREFLPTSPARFLKRPRYKVSAGGKAIPDPVIARMFTAAYEKREPLVRLRDTAILALLDCYGPRRSEIAALRLRSVDWLAVPQPVITFYRIKTHTEDTFPLPDNTRAALRAWYDFRRGLRCGHDALFVTNRPDHAPLQDESISTLIKRLSEKVADGRMYGPHSFRHRKGQSLADARVPPDVVQAILGHADVNTTLRYYYGQDQQRLAFILNAYEFDGAGESKTHARKVRPFLSASE